MRQTGVSFSQSYIEETLTRYPDIAQLLFTLFEQRLIRPSSRMPRCRPRCQAREELAAKLIRSPTWMTIASFAVMWR